MHSLNTNIIKIDYKGFGFLDFGAAPADRVGDADVRRFESYIERGCYAGMQYLARNTDKRMDPALLVPGARSVLCFLAPYGKSEGGVAGFACGKDYHKVIKDRLHLIMRHLSERYTGFEGRAFVDSAPVLERYWAARARLGFIGDNHFLISPEYGLRTLIGVIICNIPYDRFEPHQPLAEVSCGSCGKCRAACPGKALEKDFLNAARCISYLTIESSDTKRTDADFKGWIFGCEECLKACPWNKATDSWPEFEIHRDSINRLAGDGWLQLDEESFSEEFSDSGLTRAGLEKIKDNI